jgi:ubiquinone/menaquinone biosynthesis C-methylase UbiE
MGPTAFERTRPADYLIRLAKSDLGQAYKSLAITELGIEAGDTVLDLGCGPGADLPPLAQAAGPDGSVIGIDHDKDAAEQARASVAHLPNAHVRVTDVHFVGLPDGSVDRVRTDRVLQHVADPALVLREARRMLRPGGRAVFAEPDWDTLILDYPAPAVSRSYRQFIVERVVRNACVGRQVPRLAEEAGFTTLSVIPATVVFRDAARADQVLGFHRVTERAVAAGYLSDATASEWLDYLRQETTFFASLTLFMTVAEPGRV